MQYYTYILQSATSGKLYIGQTNDLIKRLSLHNSNQVLSTKYKGPWNMVFYKEFNERSKAMKLEMKLKKWKNRKKYSIGLTNRPYIFNIIQFGASRRKFSIMTQK